MGSKFSPLPWNKKYLPLFLQQISSEHLLWASCADAGSTVRGVGGWGSNMLPSSECLLANRRYSHNHIDWDLKEKKHIL